MSKSAADLVIAVRLENDRRHAKLLEECQAFRCGACSRSPGGRAQALAICLGDHYVKIQVAYPRLLPASKTSGQPGRYKALIVAQTFCDRCEQALPCLDKRCSFI